VRPIGGSSQLSRRAGSTPVWNFGCVRGHTGRIADASRLGGEGRRASPCRERPAAVGQQTEDPFRSITVEATMSVPSRRRWSREPSGSFPTTLLIVGAVTIATTIVFVTGSTSGFSDLVTLVIAVAAAADVQRRKRKR